MILILKLIYIIIILNSIRITYINRKRPLIFIMGLLTIVITTYMGLYLIEWDNLLH